MGLLATLSGPMGLAGCAVGAQPELDGGSYGVVGSGGAEASPTAEQGQENGGPTSTTGDTTSGATAEQGGSMEQAEVEAAGAESQTGDSQGQEEGPATDNDGESDGDTADQGDNGDSAEMEGDAASEDGDDGSSEDDSSSVTTTDDDGANDEANDETSSEVGSTGDTSCTPTLCRDDNPNTVPNGEVILATAIHGIEISFPEGKRIAEVELFANYGGEFDLGATLRDKHALAGPGDILVEGTNQVEVGAGWQRVEFHPPYDLAANEEIWMTWDGVMNHLAPFAQDGPVQRDIAFESAPDNWQIFSRAPMMRVYCCAE